MKYTREAIRYGIETLGVTPDELFSLIESSEGYDGDDYRRWLAARIIEVAERDGVGFTQLLVKKFAITQSLAEEYSDDGIKEEWLEYFNNIFSNFNVFSVGIEGIGSELEDVDWFNGIDIDDVNGDFVSEKLPDEVKDVFLKDDNFTLLCKLSSESADKSSDLFKNAKSAGINCKNEGSLILYRVCSMISAFEECTCNFRFAFIASTNFLFNEENKQVIRHFLNYFNYSGFVVHSTELLKDTFSKVDYAFVVCTPRGLDDSVQDGFVLDSARLENGELVLYERKRYSESSNSMYSYLENCKSGLNSNGVVIKDGKPSYGFVCSDAVCYLLRGTDGRLFISNAPVSSVECIAVNKDTFKDTVVFYGVTKSLEGFGLSRNISELITGHTSYDELFYNCLVLLLADTDNISKDYGIVLLNGKNYLVRNTLCIEDEYISSLLSSGEVYFSFEAKQMLDILRVLQEKYSGQSRIGKTYMDIMTEFGDSNINKQYLSAVIALKDYISNLYRKM